MDGRPLLVIVAAGTRGDVQPYVALGEGLQAAGYRVRLVTHEPFAGLVRRHGLAFAPLRGNPRALMEQSLGRRVMAAGHRPSDVFRGLWAIYRREMPYFLEDCRQGCAGAQGILFSILGFPAYHVAEALGVPAIGAFLQPQTRTRAFPAPVGPAPRWLARCGLYNRLTYVLLEEITWLLVRQDINRWRTETLGLPPLSWQGPYPRLYSGHIPVLYGFSEHVVPRPPDWPSSMHVTGYWFLEEDGSWTPPPDLQTFLEAGPPPVYVGFGSMRPPEPDAFARTVVEALRLAGVRGVFLTGWSGMRVQPSPDLYVAEEAPHAWLFPRVAAVVHHGGAGTTAAGLRAGQPGVVVPFLLDQFFWGHRVQALGVGPAPVPAHRLTARRLAEAVDRAVSTPAFRGQAQTLADRLRAENGVERAVALVRALLGR